MGLAVFLLLIGYGLLAWRYYRHPVVLSRNFTAEINAAILETPPEQRAWPKYREGLLQLADLNGMEDYHPANELEWSLLAPHLKERQSALQRLREGAERPGLGFPMLRYPTADDLEVLELVRGIKIRRSEFAEKIESQGDNPSLSTLSHTPFQCLHLISKFLRADTYLAWEQGDARRVVNNLLAQQKLSRHATEWRTDMMNPLMQHYILLRSDSILIDILHQSPRTFTDSDLTLFAERLTQRPQEVTWDRGRSLFLDRVQQWYSDDGRGDGLLRLQELEPLYSTPKWLKGKSPWLVDALLPLTPDAFVETRSQLVDRHESLDRRAAADFARPLWLSESLSVDAERRQFLQSALFEELRLSDLLTRIAYSSLSDMITIYSGCETSRLYRDAALTAIALERYRRTSGAWPEKLEQLLPEFLAELPLDRFDGQPLRYRLVDDQPLLYSVGTNRVDDQGYPFGDKSFNRASVDQCSECPWAWGRWNPNDPLPRGDLVFLPAPPFVPLSAMNHNASPSGSGEDQP